MKTMKCYLCKKRHKLIKRSNGQVFIDCPLKGMLIIKKNVLK